MKKWLITIVGSITFLGVYILLEYIFDKTIDWKMAIISTIIYTVLQICFKIFEARKLKKVK